MIAVRRALVVACWSAWAAAAALAQQPADRAPLFVEVDGLPAEVFVEQSFELVVRLCVDAAWLQQHAVPMFQQKLDQPFHVVVPWLQAAEDRAVELLPPPAGATTQRLAFGDRAVPFVVAGVREVDGRRFDLLTATLRWTALAPGRSLVAPVELRYAFAERFVEDFLRGREPVDRQEATIASAAASLTVVPLPPLPPAGFCGGVGEFTLQASTTASAATVGSSVPLRLEVRGAGNLDRMAPLPPPSLPGFHVQGVTSAMVAGARVFTLDLLPLRAGTTQVPPVPFVAFSPRERRYVTLASDAVPLVVAPTPADVELPPRVRLRIDLDRLELAAANEWPLWRYAALAGSVLVFVQLARGRRRRASFDRRRAANHDRLVAALASGPVEALEAFDACVLHAAGEATTVEVAWQRLAQRPVPAAAVVRLQTVRQALDAARFGGQAPAASEVLAAVRDVASTP
ncbi:MAG: hypothetical protein ACK501_23565 [Planctomycetota bacterium]